MFNPKRPKRKPKNPVTCDCPGCRGVPTADPTWGFDTALVPKVKCMGCKKPIGTEPYVLDTGLARFGQMFFYHKRCHSNERQDFPPSRTRRRP